MKRQFAFVMAPALAVALSSAASADLVYDNGDPDGGNGLGNVFDGGVGHDWMVADDFIIGGPGAFVDNVEINYIWNTIGSAEAFMVGGGVTDFRVTFYADDAGGGPGTIISDQVSSDFTETLTGDTFFDRPEVIFSVDIDRVGPFQSNTTYWVTIQPNGIERGFQLTSATGAGNLNGDQVWVRYPDLGFPYFVPGNYVFGEFYDVAFRLDHPYFIPAPGAMALLGFTGLLGLRRRRR